MQHFNGLTPAEAERLAMLAEECAEVIQAAGKILRHGYGSYHPDHPQVPNRALLGREVTDLLAVLHLMEDDFDIVPFEDSAEAENAVLRKLRFAHHQDDDQPSEAAAQADASTGVAP